ncbi:hypothetical protein H2248_003600, partial [Termitomyces sp. 'cryptogamus']
GSLDLFSLDLPLPDFGFLSASCVIEPQPPKVALTHLVPSPPSTPTTPSPLITPPSISLGASMVVHAKIPHHALSHGYNGSWVTREQFLQSCITYIQLADDAFASDMLKIVWVFSYMYEDWACVNLCAPYV